LNEKHENIASWKQVQRGCFDSQVVRLDVIALRVVELDVRGHEWSG